MCDSLVDEKFGLDSSRFGGKRNSARYGSSHGAWRRVGYGLDPRARYSA
jgi:hypothetical protein